MASSWTDRPGWRSPPPRLTVPDHGERTEPLWRAMSGGGRDDVPEAEESIPRGRGTRRRGYRYEVLCGRAGADPDALVALAATPMTAFAAYYAAVREHFGETVVLKRDGCVIQRSRPARPEA